MEAEIKNLEGKGKGKIKLPKQFNEPYRPDLIKRAVLAIQSHKRQQYGAFDEAGKRPSAKLPKRRRKYKGCYGKGISRIQRKTLTRRGTQFYNVGAFNPGTVGGRRAHPPNPEKDWEQKINEKERKKALRSAIAATTIKELVLGRGHTMNAVPIIVESKFEALSKTKDVKNTMLKLGLDSELERTSERKIRAGKGKSRGRKYRKKKGVLVVVSEKCSLLSSARNVPGVDITIVDSLNAELLAPGTEAGRLTVWTDKALQRMDKEDLFMAKKKAQKEEKKEEPKKTVKKTVVKKAPAKKAVKKKTVKKVVAKK
jgi:large subunit ribosomal protein L4e